MLIAPRECQSQTEARPSPASALLQTSYEMMMQCVSRMLAHPLHGEPPHWRPRPGRGMSPRGR